MSFSDDRKLDLLFQIFRRDSGGPEDTRPGLIGTQKGKLGERGDELNEEVFVIVDWIRCFFNYLFDITF